MSNTIIIYCLDDVPAANNVLALPFDIIECELEINFTATKEVPASFWEPTEHATLYIDTITVSRLYAYNADKVIYSFTPTKKQSNALYSLLSIETVEDQVWDYITYTEFAQGFNY